MTGIYTDPKCLEHYAPGHPESPERMKAAIQSLQRFEDGRMRLTVSRVDYAGLEVVFEQPEVK